MTRRFTSLLLLTILVAAQAAPLTASARRCPMQPAAQSRHCGQCGIPSAPAGNASVSAASCCRFEAATPAAQTPAVVPPAKSISEVAFSSVAVLSAAPCRDGSPDPRGLLVDLSALRSTASPISLHNTLRL